MINDSGRKSCSGESDSDKYCTDDQFCSESEDEADEAQRQRALHANHDGAVQQQHLVSRLELLHQSELIIIQNEDDQRAAGDRGSHGASSDWTSQHGDVVRATRLPRSTSTSARTFSAGLRERERVQEKGGSQRWGRERAAERSERKSDGKGEIEREKERERERQTDRQRDRERDREREREFRRLLLRDPVCHCQRI